MEGNKMNEITNHKIALLPICLFLHVSYSYIRKRFRKYFMK